MVPIGLFCFVVAGLGLLGFNVWYYRALTDARSEADAYWTLAQSWQKTATLAIDAMEHSRPRYAAASNPAGRDVLDRIPAGRDVLDRIPAGRDVLDRIFAME